MSETFEKPSLHQYDTDEFFYRLDQSGASDSPFDDGWGVVNVSRDPIVQTSLGQALWLYEDDPFVMDFGITTYREEEVDEVLTHDMMVLLDFEPVPFAIREFQDEESIPSTDKLMESSEFEVVNDIDFETNAGFHKFSLAIPAESFPEKAAYDLRLVSLARVAPDDEVTAMFDSVLGLGMNFSVYYGSTEVRQQDLPEIENSQLVVPSPTDNFLMSRSRNRMFIMPPEEVYDVESYPQNELRLGQAFEVDGPTPDVHAYARNSGVSGEQDRPLIMAFDGTDVLEQPFGVVEIPEQINLVEEDPDPYVAKMPLALDIQSSEEPHTLRVLRFDYPLERRTYDVDEGRGYLFDPSPPLFLKRAQE